MQLRNALVLTLVSAYFVHAQNPKADSLQLALAKHPQLDTVRVNILNGLAFEKHFGDPEKSVQYSTEARDLSYQLNYAKGLALSYRLTGLAFWAQANLSYALEYFVKGLKIADSLNYTQIQADLTGNIGLVYNGLGNYLQARHFFETSLEKQRLLKNRKREIIMLNNLGDCYFLQKDYRGALRTYGESLRLGTPIDFLMETNNRNIGNVYEAMGNLDSAMNHYLISQKLSNRFNERKEKAMVRLSIASINLKRGHVSEGEELAQMAAKLAETGKYRAQLRDAYAMLSNIANTQGKFKQAFEYYARSIAYRDSIQNLVENSRMASVRLEYEMQRKQMEINQLKTDTQLKEVDLSLKNTLLFFSIIVVVLLAVFIFTTVRNNKLLKVRNSEISQQQNELIALNEEIVTQREEVMTQRDSLAQKNTEIENINQKMVQVNENLELLVQQRTRVLEEQNEKLSEYAFFNAHKLRAPLARVMGLVNLLLVNSETNELSLILSHLKKSSEDLDTVVKSISTTLNEGLDAFPEDKRKGA